MNIKLYIHCVKCMETTQMEKSLMVFVEKVVFDNSDISRYECPNCKHQIEIEVGTEAN